MPTSLSEILRLMLREAYYRRNLVLTIFVSFAVITTIVGINWPKSYTSYSTVYVELESVIAPLMEGAAVQSRLTDRAVIASEVIYGRKLLNRIVAMGGWTEEGDADPSRLEEIIEGITRRTLVTNVGENLVRIEYSDQDPKRAMLVAQKMGELFISESLAAKSKESESAYAFIDQQVKEYQQKLQKLEQGLKEFRNSNADARPGADLDSVRRLTDLKDRLVQLDQEQREAQIRKASLEAQLSGEVDAANVISRAEAYRGRIVELRSQLDNLRLTYHETYPDIVRVKDQISELEAAAQAEEQRRTSQGKSGDRPAYPDETLLANPLYQELRAGLYEANTTIQTLTSRITETRRQIEEEEARGKRIQEAAAEAAALTRDYEVNTQLYQDLLRRREAARVSMSLGRTQNGMTMRVEEPAFLPHKAEGPSLALFMVGGVLLGVVVPLGVILGLQQIDPRIRHPSVVSERLGLRALGVVPHLHTPREATSEARNAFSMGITVLAALSFVAALGAMRLMGVL